MPPRCPAPQSQLFGQNDIDSIFMCGSSLLLFEPKVKTTLNDNLNYYSKFENEKAIPALEPWLLEKGFTKNCISFVEYNLVHSDLHKIFVLFLLDKSGGQYINFAQAYNTKVIKVAVEMVSKHTNTSMINVVRKECTKENSIIYKEDYEEFCSYVDVLTIDFKTQHTTVVDIVFYTATHGIRSSVPDGIEFISEIINNDYSNLFITGQIHIGTSIKCPPNTIFLLDLDRLKKITGTYGVSLKPNFFFKRYGYAYGRHFKLLPEIQYFQFYETVSHNIKSKEHGESFLQYRLFNGLQHQWMKFGNAAMKCRNKLAEYDQYLKNMADNADLRVEILVKINDIKDIDDKNFGIDWSAMNSSTMDKFPLQELLSYVIKANVIVMMKNWSEYVDENIGVEMKLLHTIHVPRCAPSKKLLEATYVSEQRLIAFIDMHHARYDVNFVKRITYPNDGDLIIMRRNNIELSDDEFQKYNVERFKQFIIHGPKLYQMLYRTAREECDGLPIQYDHPFSTLDDPKLLVPYFFGRLVMALMIISGEQVQSEIRDTDAAYYFKRERRGQQYNIKIKVGDVLNSIKTPKTVLIQLVTMHCFGYMRRFEQKYIPEIINYIKENVRNWPTILYNQTGTYNTWSPVLTDEEIRTFITGTKLSEVPTMAGSIVKELHLKQWKKIKVPMLKKIYENAPNGVAPYEKSARNKTKKVPQQKPPTIIDEIIQMEEPQVQPIPEPMKETQMIVNPLKNGERVRAQQVKSAARNEIKKVPQRKPPTIIDEIIQMEEPQLQPMKETEMIVNPLKNRKRVRAQQVMSGKKSRVNYEDGEIHLLFKYLLPHKTALAKGKKIKNLWVDASAYFAAHGIKRGKRSIEKKARCLSALSITTLMDDYKLSKEDATIISGAWK